MELTPQEKTQLLPLHAQNRDQRTCDRIKAVIHASDGWSAQDIAAALLIHETTVWQHIHDYVQSKKLQPENGGSKSQLSQAQTQELITHLSEYTYSETKQIIIFVKERFGISYSVAGMTKWLHHHHFGYKKPKGVAHKFDEVKQQAFID